MRLPLRFYARFPCRLRAWVRCPGRSAPIEVEIRDIGMGGALIRSAADLAGPRVEVDLPEESGSFAVRTEITRRIAPGPGEEENARVYAVAFVPHFSIRHKLQKLVDRIRRMQRK